MDSASERKEKVSLGQSKKLLGGKAVFGGFEQKGVLYTGTREDAENYAYNILDEAGQVGVMLFAVLTIYGTGSEVTNIAILNRTRLMDNNFVPFNETRVLKIYTELY